MQLLKKAKTQKEKKEKLSLDVFMSKSDLENINLERIAGGNLDICHFPKADTSHLTLRSCTRPVCGGSE
jgi:hypothetical protein